jgi:MFS family permease
MAKIPRAASSGHSRGSFRSHSSEPSTDSRKRVRQQAESRPLRWPDRHDHRIFRPLHLCDRGGARLPEAFPPGVRSRVAILASLATFAIAFLARPIGSALFAHFGDRVGRTTTLVAALLTMGVSTVAIGALPTYGTIGVAAPLPLALCRFGQALSDGGSLYGKLADVSSRRNLRRFARSLHCHIAREELWATVCRLLPPCLGGAHVHRVAWSARDQGRRAVISKSFLFFLHSICSVAPPSTFKLQPLICPRISASARATIRTTASDGLKPRA